MLRLYRPDECECGCTEDIHTRYSAGRYCSMCRECDIWRRVKKLVIAWGRA